MIERTFIAGPSDYFAQARGRDRVHWQPVSDHRSSHPHAAPAGSWLPAITPQGWREHPSDTAETGAEQPALGHDPAEAAIAFLVSSGSPIGSGRWRTYRADR